MRLRRLQARAHEGERVAAVEGVLVDELELARHVDGREVLILIKRMVADGGDVVVQVDAGEIVAVLEGAVADVRYTGVVLRAAVPLLICRTGDVGQDEIVLADGFPGI